MTEPPAIVGRYHVERLIAHGGMGSLYLARDPAIDRQVVIKLLQEGFDDAAARERFAREARAAGRLHHPNIVTVFDVGEHDAARSSPWSTCRRDARSSSFDGGRPAASGEAGDPRRRVRGPALCARRRASSIATSSRPMSCVDNSAW